jgi:hypothetical protein
MRFMEAHGFHHKVCQRKSFHVPDENCLCKLCGRYHIVVCKQRAQSVTVYAEDD